MAIIAVDRCAGAIQSGTGASINRTLPNVLAIGDQVAVLVMHGSSAALSTVAGWTKSVEVLRSVSVSACIYTAVVTTAGQQTSLQSFTYPAGSVLWRDIVDMVRIQGAVAGPEVTGSINTGAIGTTASTGSLSAAPSVTGALVLGLVATSAGNGGSIDDATYPTNGFTWAQVIGTTTRRGVSVYKENAPAAVTSSTVKWTASTYPVGCIAAWVPTAAPPPPNVPPVASAGPDQVVAQNVTVTFAGSGSDTDGTISARQWVAPFGITLSSTTIFNPTWAVGTTAAGTYPFQYRVQDDDGAWSPYDTVIITVQSPISPPANIAPTASAGSDQTVTVGATVQLAGFGTDSDGTIVAHQWVAPAGVTLSSLTVATPTWNTTGVAPAIYTFTYRVRDDDGAYSPYDAVAVTVVAAPVVPITTTPQWVTCINHWTAPFNAASRVLRLIRTGGSGGGGGGTGLPYTLPFTLDATSGSGDLSYVRHVYAGPGNVSTWSSGGGIPSVVAERSLDFGVSTSPLRLVDSSIPGNGTITLVDYEAPSAQPYWLRAKATDESSGFLLTSEWSSWAEITPLADTWWLKDPLDSDRNVRVSVAPGWKPARPVRAGVFDVAGRDRPVVSSGAISGWRGTATFWVLEPSDYELLMNEHTGLLWSRRTLLLQSVLGQQWYVRVVGEPSESQIRTPARPEEVGIMRHSFQVDVPLVETARP